MQTYSEIQTEIAKLQERAKQVLATEVATVVADINEKIALYGLTPGDLKFKAEVKGTAPKAGKKNAPVKYKDKSGNTWSGRGLKPKWLTAALASGANLTDFAV